MLSNLVRSKILSCGNGLNDCLLCTAAHRYMCDAMSVRKHTFSVFFSVFVALVKDNASMSLILNFENRVSYFVQTEGSRPY